MVSIWVSTSHHFGVTLMYFSRPSFQTHITDIKHFIIIISIFWNDHNRAHNPKVRGSNPLPATSFIFNNISILRALLCLKNRGLYFYTPHYTPHTFPFFPTNLLFQTQEVQTKPASRCVHHSRSYQLLHENPSKNYLFVELHEHRSVAKKYWIELNSPLERNCSSRGWGNKTGPITDIEHSTPLLWKNLVNKNPIYQGLLVWPGVLLAGINVLNTQDGKR